MEVVMAMARAEVKSVDLAAVETPVVVLMEMARGGGGQATAW